MSDRPTGWRDLAVLPVVLVLSTPPLVWFGHHWTVFIDSAEYLLLSGNLASGEGYTHASGAPFTKRGPILPGIISALILAFGRDVESLAWGVRLLALANPLFAYFLIKRVSGPKAGLLAAALVALFSYTATITEAFNIDTTLLTVYLPAVLAILVAAQRDDRFSLALLSGLLLGASILTKETSFTNLPLALFAGLLLNWNLRGVSLHYLGVLLVCLPWWVWVLSTDNEIYLVGKLPTALYIPVVVAILVGLGLVVGLYISGMPAGFLASARRREWTGRVLVVAWVIVMSGLLLTTSVALAESSLGIVSRFVVERLARYTPLWPLLLVAGGYVVWKALGRRRLWEFYAAALALQLPVCLLATVEGWSLRQFLILQVLLLGALAALVVEVFEAASRQGAYRRLATLGAVSLAIYLSISTVGHVLTLLGEPENWRSLDRTSRVPQSSAVTVSVMHDMHGWLAENVPKGENILLSVYYENYLRFLDADRHEWSNLKLDCETGRLNPTTSGCVPSETIAESPPKPTIWFYMQKDCTAIALSMPNLRKQLERSDSTYLMLSSNPKYPAVLGSVQYLLDSGAFEVAHVERRALRGTGEQYVMAVYLLERTGQAPRAVPTRMDARTVNHLVKCETSEGSAHMQSMRAKFPNGVALVPDSNRDGNLRAEAQVTARAREAIRELLPDRLREPGKPTF